MAATAQTVQIKLYVVQQKLEVQMSRFHHALRDPIVSRFHRRCSAIMLLLLIVGCRVGHDLEQYVLGLATKEAVIEAFGEPKPFCRFRKGEKAQIQGGWGVPPHDVEHFAFCYLGAPGSIRNQGLWGVDYALFVFVNEEGKVTHAWVGGS